MARDDRAIFGPDHDYQEEIIAACETLSKELGLDFRASGARDPRHSLEAARPADFAPWGGCMRPWTTAYVTANGNCLPCCISPFATSHYSSLILGNLFERPPRSGAITLPNISHDLLSTSPPGLFACGVY
jgi:hypothetical protein